MLKLTYFSIHTRPYVSIPKKMNLIGTRRRMNIKAANANSTGGDKPKTHVCPGAKIYNRSNIWIAEEEQYN